VADFGRDLRREARVGERNEFLFFFWYITHDFTDFPSATFHEIYTRDVDL